MSDHVSHNLLYLQKDNAAQVRSVILELSGSEDVPLEQR